RTCSTTRASQGRELMARYGAAAALVIGVLAFTIAPACAQSGWQDLPAVKSLYDKAKAEGEGGIWGPTHIEVAWLAVEFPKRFPGMAVKGTGDLQAATKLIAEARANRHSVDVWQNSLGGMLEVQKRGLFVKVDWRQYAIGDGNILFDGE